MLMLEQAEQHLKEMRAVLLAAVLARAEVAVEAAQAAEEKALQNTAMAAGVATADVARARAAVSAVMDEVATPDA
eukprot:12194422-Prorocentrum_lima.AAC.1